MARLRRDTDMKALALNRYELLLKESAGIEAELKGLQEYLKAIGGATKGKDRGKGQPQLPYERRAVTQKGRKESATQAISTLIANPETGISIDEMMKQTGLMRSTVNGILNRLKKERKIKAVARGVYVKQNSTGQSGTKSKAPKKNTQPAPEGAAVPRKRSKPKAKAPAKRSSHAKKKPQAREANSQKAEPEMSNG